VIAAADLAITKARSAVTVVLRSEMNRRRDLAQSAAAEAERNYQEASRERSKATEGLAQATGAASQAGATLRAILIEEISAAVSHWA
jgi:hypothetical protein